MEIIRSVFIDTCLLAVDHSIEALDVGRLGLLQDRPCAVKANPHRPR